MLNNWQEFCDLSILTVDSETHLSKPRRKRESEIECENVHQCVSKCCQSSYTVIRKTPTPKTLSGTTWIDWGLDWPGIAVGLRRLKLVESTSNCTDRFRNQSVSEGTETDQPFEIAWQCVEKTSCCFLFPKPLEERMHWNTSFYAAKGRKRKRW